MGVRLTVSATLKGGVADGGGVAGKTSATTTLFLKGGGGGGSSGSSRIEVAEISLALRKKGRLFSSSRPAAQKGRREVVSLSRPRIRIIRICLNPDGSACRE